MDTPILLGVAFSLATSIFKALKLPDRYAFAINLIAGAIYAGALICQGSEPKAAAGQAVLAVMVSYTTYKTVGAPIRELVAPRNALFQAAVSEAVPIDWRHPAQTSSNVIEECPPEPPVEK